MTELRTDIDHAVRVLVVDDEAHVVRSLEISFMDELEVLTATSGEQALEALGRRPDVGVILTDQRMPGMTGVELLARSRETHPDAVRVLLTGFTDVEALVDAINEAQVYRYVSKPWEPRDLEIETPSWNTETRGSLVASPESEVMPRITKPGLFGDWFWTSKPGT